ncbi:MAG: hypothetical protein ABH863_04360 [Candidatus Micrarchaeota archaeon]
MPSEAVERIRSHLNSRGAPEGILLLHRSSEEVADETLKTGLIIRTLVQSTATEHSRIDKEFEREIGTSHMGSRNVVVAYVPEHARELVRDASHGTINPRADYVNRFAQMFRRVPPQWIVGTYNRISKKFSPNEHFNPFNNPPLPEWEAKSTHRRRPSNMPT